MSGRKKSGRRSAQPDRAGLGCLLPDSGVQRTFTALDHCLWKLTYKWAKHTHPNKPTPWIINQYYGTFNKFRNDRWVFGDRDSRAYLHRFARIRIVRHQMVTGTASTDDPALATGPTCGARGHAFRWTEPGCVSCRHSTGTARAAATRKAMTHNAIALRADGTPDDTDLRLIHAYCQRHIAHGSSPALLPAHQPKGLA